MKIETPFVKIIPISNDNVDQRLDNFLCTKLKGVPKSMIYRLLRKGNIRINKKRTKPRYKLKIYDEVQIPSIRIAKQKEKIISPHLKKIAALSNVILYEDDYILALNKPSGIAVHGGNELNFGVIEGLRVLRPEMKSLWLVHRLDRDTSGILLIAKKRSALRSLHEQLRNKEIRKDYLALVHGYWKSYMRAVQAPLIKNISQNGKRIVHVNQNGKISKTNFKVEERYKFTTLIRCTPITGRTHQIRVHTQYVGHPIAFDNRYGDRKFDNYLVDTGLSRLFLHAEKLKFIHPNTGKIIQIRAPIDKQLKHCIKILRSQNNYVLNKNK